MYKITFKFEQKGLAPVTIDNIEADQSILEVALKNDIDFTIIAAVFAPAVPAMYMWNKAKTWWKS